MFKSFPSSSKRSLWLRFSHHTCLYFFFHQPLQQVYLTSTPVELTILEILKCLNILWILHSYTIRTWNVCVNSRIPLSSKQFPLHSQSTTNKMLRFSIYFCKTLYVFRTGFTSIIRSSKLHIQRQVLVWPLLLPAASLARLKHVERLTEINKLWNVASCWLYSANVLAMHGPMNVKSYNSVRVGCFQCKRQ